MSFRPISSARRRTPTIDKHRHAPPGMFRRPWRKDPELPVEVDRPLPREQQPRLLFAEDPDVDIFNGQGKRVTEEGTPVPIGWCTCPAATIPSARCRRCSRS